MILSELYVATSTAHFEEEPVTGDESVSAGASQRPGKKNPKALATMLPAFSKAWEKLDAPASLSHKEKAAVKRVCAKLEEAQGIIEAPSILGVTWQLKLDVAVADWTDGDRTLFEAEFVRLETVHQNVKALKEGV